MRKKILNHTCFLIVLSVLLTFLAAGLVMYEKYNEDLKESVRDSTKYIQDGVEKMGNSYLEHSVRQLQLVLHFWIRKEMYCLIRWKIPQNLRTTAIVRSLFRQKKVAMRKHCDIQKPCPNRIFTVR